MDTKNKVYLGIIGALVLVVVYLLGSGGQGVKLGAYNGGVSHTNSQWDAIGGYAVNGTTVISSTTAFTATSLTNTGSLTQSGTAAFSATTTVTGLLTVGSTTVPSGDAQILDTTGASSTLYIGQANGTGCLVLGDSANNGNLVYITATTSTVSATTTKPRACR